jgi:hypothetical protein
VSISSLSTIFTPDIFDHPNTVHNFFDPQPPRDHPPAIFLLRLISHDFSDSYLIKILSNLRRSAGPQTKLLIQDLILLHACPETEGESADPGLGVGSAKGHGQVKITGEPIPPLPLLRNWAKTGPYLADIMVGILSSFIILFIHSFTRSFTIRSAVTNRSNLSFLIDAKQSKWTRTHPSQFPACVLLERVGPSRSYAGRGNRAPYATVDRGTGRRTRRCPLSGSLTLIRK